MGCGIFIFTISRSYLISLWALIYLAGILFVQHVIVMHILSEIFCFHVTADYFINRINSLVNKFQSLSSHYDLNLEKKLRKALNCYDKFMFDLKRRNSSLRYLLRNMSYGYCTSLAFVLFSYSIDMPWWMKVIILTAATSFAGVIIGAELYVGRLQGEIVQLYHQVNFAAAKIAFSNSICLKTKLRLRTVIKELGSEKKRWTVCNWMDKRNFRCILYKRCC